MKVLLLSTYELGRQPFGLASPAAWLRQAGAEVTCLDLSRDSLREDAVRDAGLVAFYVPMHTATRMAARAAARVRKLNPKAHLCFYGLYAPVNESYLRQLGADTVLGGEFEQGMVNLFHHLSAGKNGGSQTEPVISLGRQKFMAPDRRGLPDLRRYAHVHAADGRRLTAGYTEASRGCKHLCRHCPIVPVYHGAFRVVQRDVVLEDIRRQVGSGAEHITFGDPDFFNGIGHAMALVEAVHREHPWLTYDVTTKIEHLLKHARHLPTLRDTGCLFVTSAVESLDDRVLFLLEKGHTRADFLRVVETFREIGLVLNPTFVTFTPWTTLEGYCGLLRTLAALDLVDNVAPIQLAIRLLIPAGSRLLELEEVQRLVDPFEEAALCYPWRHPDPRVDHLCEQLQNLVARSDDNRRALFASVWNLAHQAAGIPAPALPRAGHLSRAEIPYLNEPWYC